MTFPQPVPPAFLSCVGQHVDAPRAEGGLWAPPQPAQREDSGPGPGQRKGTMTRAKAVQRARTSCVHWHPSPRTQLPEPRGLPCLLGLEPHSKLGPSLGPRLHTRGVRARGLPKLQRAGCRHHQQKPPPCKQHLRMPGAAMSISRGLMKPGGFE